jgi:hypothetical protein
MRASWFEPAERFSGRQSNYIAEGSGVGDRWLVIGGLRLVKYLTKLAAHQGVFCARRCTFLQNSKIEAKSARHCGEKDQSD